MKLFNSLTQHVEEFSPRESGKVGMYTCGPTVYDYATIGNFRTYTTGDILVRTLRVLGYDVTYIMNITDVGHLTGDNMGDSSGGTDRMENAAAREGRTAWDIASFYREAFIDDFHKLHLLAPAKWTKATDHIPEQIALVKTLEEKGYTYRTSDGIYFDTTKFPAYGALSNLDEVKEGARVQVNPERKNPRDFALWKFSTEGEKRHMEWDSPWGIGFPGWHIECSAMSMKYLGPSFDIHVGGEDLKSTHHPNEIAQSEAATGQPFVKYWVHSSFLLVNGGRMGKSLGNAYTLHDIEQHKFPPLALRYFYFTAHYRTNLNFTWEALEAASNSLKKLEQFIARATVRVQPDTTFRNAYVEEFVGHLMNDLHTPNALATMWSMLKSDLSDEEKLKTLFKMDEVLGFDLASVKTEADLPEEVRELLVARAQARAQGNWSESDRLRDAMHELGFMVEDTPDGQRALPRS